MEFHRRYCVYAAWLALGVALSGCCGGGKDPPPSRWDTAGKPAATATQSGSGPVTAGGAASASEPKAQEGSAFNKFFPADGTEGAAIVFTQEKTGFSEAKLNKDGKEAATLSITDTASNPAARAKYDAATDKVEGYPYVALGKTQSSVLVKGRYQVKVASPTLTEAERKTWLQRFKLAGLAEL